MPSPLSHRAAVVRRTVLVAAPLLIFSCTPTNLVEREIESQLPSYIGPADRYDVDIDGLRVRESAADRLVMVGDRVRPDGSPVLDQLTIELTGIQYSREAGQLTQVASATAVARVNVADLALFVEAQPNIRTAALTLSAPNQATLSVNPEIEGLPIPDGVNLSVTGELVGNGSQVIYTISDVRAAGLNVSRVAAQQLNSVLNPLVDLSDLPVTLIVKSVTVEGDSIVLEVTGDPASFVRQ